MTRNRLITVVLTVVVLGLVGLTYLANRPVTPATKVKVIKKATKKSVVAPKCVCPTAEDLQVPPKPKSSAAVSTAASPAAPAAAASRPSDGWRPVLTKDGWIRLGLPSTVPAPKVPPKGIEGPDIR